MISLQVLTITNIAFIWFVGFRFESLDMELQNRLDDKMWLVKHLERTRLLVLDDLIVVKVSLIITLKAQFSSPCELK